MLDYAVKDTWRIFRIMGEFVEGFETLSQIEGVSIFGSARSAPGSVDYKNAEEMGRALWVGKPQASSPPSPRPCLRR